MTPPTPDTIESVGYHAVKTQQWRNQQLRPLVDDNVVEEVPVALVYNGISQAVMMATPCDLEDFAIGFSLAENIVDSIEQIYDLQIDKHENGYEVNVQISSEKMLALKNYRRSMTGNSGCGLCGVDSLDGAIRPGRIVEKSPLPDPLIIQHAVEHLADWQRIRQQTGGSHAAVWCNDQGHKVLLREDVGRHNAFDKLIGAMATRKMSSNTGFALISSRASYEMVIKSSYLQCANLIAVSAPTTLAITQARKFNINLIGFARSGKHNIYHHSIT
jgi:FdhD protein